MQLSETEKSEKKTQLKIVDRLIERRLDQISFSQLQKDVSEGKIEMLLKYLSKDAFRTIHFFIATYFSLWE